VERCWGVLETHWNGDLLDSVDAVPRCAASMTWKGRHPVVQYVTTVYKTVARLAKAAVEAQVERRSDLPKWVVDIPHPAGPQLFADPLRQQITSSLQEAQRLNSPHILEADGGRHCP